MKDVIIDFKKMKVLKKLLEGEDLSKENKEENRTNSNVLELKNITLYEPISYEQLLKINKKKYRNAELNKTKHHFEECLWHLNKTIQQYKSLINKTEYWEEKSTYNFNFKDWNTLKKANGKLTRYFNDICKILKNIESETK